MFKFGKRFLIGFTAIGFSTLGYAQSDADHHDGRADARESDNPERFADRVARKQAALHDALKLMPEQEAPWKAFTEKTRPTRPMPLPDKGQMARLSAPQRMEKMLAMMREGEQRLSVRLDATKAFYAVLTPAQQTTFDKQFSGRPHHGMRSGGPWQHPDGE